MQARATYAPHGGPAQVWMGNTLVDNYGYNKRLQVQDFSTSVNNNGGNTFLWFHLNWGMTNNNGNVPSVDEYNGGLPFYPSWLRFTQTYAYDNLNRISSVTDTGYTRSFQYDQYGNMWSPGAGQTCIQASALTPSTNVFSGNRMNGASYDAAGNQLVIGAMTLTYDAENRQKSATNPPAYGGGTVYYQYDGLGQRVEKAMDSGLTVYVYDIFGGVAAEYTYPSYEHHWRGARGVHMMDTLSSSRTFRPLSVRSSSSVLHLKSAASGHWPGLGGPNGIRRYRMQIQPELVSCLK